MTTGGNDVNICVSFCVCSRPAVSGRRAAIVLVLLWLSHEEVQEPFDWPPWGDGNEVHGFSFVCCLFLSPPPVGGACRVRGAALVVVERLGYRHGGPSGRHQAAPCYCNDHLKSPSVCLFV